MAWGNVILAKRKKWFAYIDRFDFWVRKRGAYKNHTDYVIAECLDKEDVNFIVNRLNMIEKMKELREGGTKMNQAIVDLLDKLEDK